MAPDLSLLRPIVLTLGLCAVLGACAPKLPEGVDDYALQEAVAASIGDASTCVVLLDKETGRKVWSHGALTACAAEWAACTRPGTQAVEDLAREAVKGAVVMTGCESVSWAAGPVGESSLVYGAVMRGERALPGREIARRLEGVFKRAGL